MNKRVRKKIEKLKRQRIHKVLDAVLDVNGLGERRVEKTGNLPTAFFGFSGHIGFITAEIHEKGWDYPCGEKSYDLFHRVENMSKKDYEKIVSEIRKYQKCIAM